MQDIVLIHGTWCDGSVWGDFAHKLEKMDLRVHTSSLRYHDLPYDEVVDKVGAVDYADDLTALELSEKSYLSNSQKRPPIGKSFSYYLFHYNIDQFIYNCNHLDHYLTSDFSLDFFVCQSYFFKFSW